MRLFQESILHSLVFIGLVFVCNLLLALNHASAFIVNRAQVGSFRRIQPTSFDARLWSRKEKRQSKGDLSQERKSARTRNDEADDDETFTPNSSFHLEDETAINGNADPSSSSSFRPTKRSSKKMELMWCTKEYCKEVIREKAIGDHNQIVLTGPATGQVAYVWDEIDSRDESSVNATTTTTTDSRSILLLVKHGDDELMGIAAEAVRNLTTRTDIHIEVLLHPGVAARMKHYHGVDGDRIHLFEAIVPTPGFGGNLRQQLSRSEMEMLLDDQDLALDESIVPPWSVYTKSKKKMDKENGLTRSEIQLEKRKQKNSGLKTNIAPDLIVTLGGDGLLMHAGMMFQGPMPPILCVAGGSMGFLTPFHITEMGDAVAIALGMVSEQEDDDASQEEEVPYIEDALVDIDDYNDYNDIDAIDTGILPEMARKLNTDGHFFSYGRNDNLSICLSIRMRLECRILNREGVVRARWNVLNEVVIDRGSSPYLAALECFVDDEHLTTVQADGIIFATPTGSTAYSLAAGSSVVHPAVPSILVTPICPHVLSFRSMVFPDHVVLRCFVPLDARSEASVAFDGKHRQELRRGDSVQVQMSPYPVPTINRKSHSADWLDSLKRNFNFNARARQRPLQQ